MDLKFIEKASDAISSKYRLDILMEIAKKGSVCYSEVQTLTGLSQPCISHHIKILTNSDLLVATKKGRTVELSVNKAKMQQLSLFFGKLGE